MRVDGLFHQTAPLRGGRGAWVPADHQTATVDDATGSPDPMLVAIAATATFVFLPWERLLRWIPAVPVAVAFVTIFLPSPSSTAAYLPEVLGLLGLSGATVWHPQAP